MQVIGFLTWLRARLGKDRWRDLQREHRAGLTEDERRQLDRRHRARQMARIGTGEWRRRRAEAQRRRTARLKAG